MGDAADDAYELAEKGLYELLATRRLVRTIPDEELVRIIEEWSQRPGFAPTMILSQPICQTFRQSEGKLSPKQRGVLESEYVNHRFLLDIDLEDGSDL